MKLRHQNKIISYVLNRCIRGDHKPIIVCGCVVFIVFICGTNDKESVSMYLNKLQSYAYYKIQEKQRKAVIHFYLNNTHRDPLKKERHQRRAQFNSSKKNIKQQWEAAYKISWPQTEKIEAHHIVPINSGGANQWWNITPISPKNHKLIHDSLEEKACFSHDFFHRRFVRFLLKAQSILLFIFKSYINKKGTNYAAEL